MIVAQFHEYGAAHRAFCSDVKQPDLRRITADGFDWA